MTLMGPGKILPPLAVAMVAAYGCLIGVDKAFGGPLPSTLTKEWAAATAAQRSAWPRSDSGADPVVMDPIHVK